MKNIRQAMKLDIQILQPYWMWLLMFFGMSLLFTIPLGGDGAMFMFQFAIFASFFSAFNFEAAEKSNLNILFATLPTTRQTMLKARYGFSLILLVGSLIVSVITGVVIDVLLNNDIVVTTYLVFVAITIGLFFVSSGFYMPFMYKMGYVKAKIFMWAPLVVLMIVMFLPAFLDTINAGFTFNVFDIVFDHQWATSIVMIVAGVSAFVVSYMVSKKIYLNKDY